MVYHVHTMKQIYVVLDYDYDGSNDIYFTEDQNDALSKAESLPNDNDSLGRLVLLYPVGEVVNNKCVELWRKQF